MVYVVMGIVRDIHVEGEQIHFTFDGSERQVATKDFDPTIREGDWASFSGGDNSLHSQRSSQVSWVRVTRTEPPAPAPSPLPRPVERTPTLDPSLFPPDMISLSWSDPGSGSPRTLRVTLPATIGRGSDATVCLIDPEISREHARLERADGRVVVVDSSANGTLVNGWRVQHRAFVVDGATVQIGPYQLTIRDASVPDDPPTVSPGAQWVSPPVPARSQTVRRSAAEQTAVRAAGKQIGVALLLMLLMVLLAIAVIAIVGTSAHSGSSTVFVPVGGGIVIFVGFFRALLLLLVGLRNLTVALARRPR